MDQNDISMDSEVLYPILFIPKKCTRLESNCEASENVFIDLKIISPDTEGNDMCIYSGFCNIKLVDSYDVKIQQDKLPLDQDLSEIYINDVDDIPVIIADSSSGQSSFNQSEEVWIDPSRSPYVYNHYDTTSQVQEASHYSIHQETHTSRITFEQNNTYITKNVYNYKEAVHYSTPEDFEHKKFRKVQKCETGQPLESYEDDEFECGVFLSHLPEEIIHEKETKDREERKFFGSKSENSALKQLMSSNIQSACKQRKTILYLGAQAHRGQTVQQVAYTDPQLACPRAGAGAGAGTAPGAGAGAGETEPDFSTEVEIDDIVSEHSPNQKKYQCAKCHQIFDQISRLKDHMVNHPSPRPRRTRHTSEDEIRFLCLDCGKNLKTREKFEIHCLGHGNPDLECSRCGKVFASKFTLRAHKKIHSRKHPCNFCTRTYSNQDELRHHISKAHSVFMCEECEFTAPKYSELNTHMMEKHCRFSDSETEMAESFIEEIMSGSEVTAQSPEYSDWKLDDAEDDKGDVARYEQVVEEQAPPAPASDQVKQADDVIAKVMNNTAFLSQKTGRSKRYTKVCDVCLKTFDRVSDLKRHLIEHVVRSTLAKSPVSKNGTLNIQCEVCRSETFTRIDKYKAHLRDHAKLTLYQCTFCNKSFSDSSNFSKHKKIHGVTFFQCDLCQRKFNSKKMIAQHMEYHNKNPPLQCCFCDREFHFESMLNKHIKSAHTRQEVNKFKCRFCQEYFKTLREKWDHEWAVHKVRKMIVDCLVCGCKFRKYAELKRHCIEKHEMDIPPANKLLKKRKGKARNY